MNSHKYWIILTIAMTILLSLSCRALSGGKTPTVEELSPTPSKAETKPTKTPEAGPPQEVLLGEEIRSEAGGFAFQSIKGYTITEEMGTVTMAAPDVDPDIGPSIYFYGMPILPGTTVEIFMDNIRADPNTTLGETEPFSLAGAEGSRADFTVKDGDNLTAGRIIVLHVSETQQFTAVGGAPPDVWEAGFSELFDQVIQTVYFFEPLAISLPTEIVPLPTLEFSFVGIELSQWAYGAWAGSHYGGGEDWAESQAAGKPDTPQCGDFNTAWASENSDSYDWIELYYDIPVLPTRVNIYQTYNPNQVIRVTLKTEVGEEFIIYDESPKAEKTCPYNLYIPVSGVETRVVAVFIEIDQSILGLGWNEIDAVELVGLPEDDSLIKPFSSDNIEFFPSEILPVGSFYYEVFGELVNDAVTDSTLVSESDDNAVIFGLARSDMSVLLMFYLPKDIKPDTYLVKPFQLAPGASTPGYENLPTAQLTANDSVFEATTGAIRIYDYQNGFMTGSFSITFTHLLLPGNTVEVLGAFNEVEVK